jgi:hypothetical protein
LVCKNLKRGIRHSPDLLKSFWYLRLSPDRILCNFQAEH